MLRVRQQLTHRRELDQLAPPQHRDPIGDLRDDAEIVRDEQNAGAVQSLHLPDQRENLRLRGDIERGRRLVGDQELRIEHQGHRDHDALALSAGQLMRIRRYHPLDVRQMDVADDLRHARAPLGGAHRCMRRQDLVDLLAAAHHRVERRHRLLEDHRHAGAAQLAQSRFAGGEQILALEQHPPAAGRELGRQQSHRRLRDHRFAGARFSYQADDLAGRHVEADALDRVRAFRADRQRDGQMVDGQQGGSHA